MLDPKTIERIERLACEYVEPRYSNNDDSAADNFGSYKAGAIAEAERAMDLEIDAFEMAGFYARRDDIISDGASPAKTFLNRYRSGRNGAGNVSQA